MKPVLLDCDGVLSNFVASALRIINTLAGTAYAHDDVTTWEVESLCPPELQPEFWAQVCAPGFVRDMEPYPGAVEAVSLLRERYGVHIVTARMRQSPTWVDEREAWLERHFGIPYKLVTSTHGKSVCAGIALVDDKPAHVIDWAAAHPQGIAMLLDRPYNRAAEIPGGVRVHGWADVLGRLGEVQRG